MSQQSFHSKKLLIFDLGETLIDFNLTGKWYQILQKNAIPKMYTTLKREYDNFSSRSIPFQQFQSIAYQKLSKAHDPQPMAERVREYFQYFRIPFETSLIESQIQAWYDAIKSYPKIYPEVQEVLRQLAKLPNFILSLWSDTPFQTPGKYIEKFMYQFKIRRYFDSVFFSGDHELRKPDPNTLQIIHQLYQLDNDEMIYIGNSEHDVLVGRNFGIDTIWVNRDQQKYPDPANPPTYTVKSLIELENLLAK